MFASFVLKIYLLKYSIIILVFLLCHMNEEKLHVNIFVAIRNYLYYNIILEIMTIIFFTVFILQSNEFGLCPRVTANNLLQSASYITQTTQPVFIFVGFKINSIQHTRLCYNEKIVNSIWRVCCAQLKFLFIYLL